MDGEQWRLHVVFGDGNATLVYPPFIAAPALTITTAYQIAAIDSSGDYTVSVIDALDPTTQDSEKCGQANPNNLEIGREDDGDTDVEVDQVCPDAFQLAADYTMAMQHDANLTCTIEQVGGSGPATFAHPPYLTSGNLGLRVRSIDVDFHYLLVVASL